MNRAFRTAEIVDVSRNELLASFQPVDAVLLSGVMSPDGSVAVWGSGTGLLTVLDLEALRADGALDEDRHVQQFDAGDGNVELGLDVDGHLVSAVVGGSQVVLIDHTTGERIVNFDVTDAGGVALHGGFLHYTDGDAIRSMPLDLDEAVAEAVASLTRDWTPEECDEYAIPECPT